MIWEGVVYIYVETSKSINPSFCTGRYVTLKPSFSKARHESNTHLCSW